MSEAMMRKAEPDRRLLMFAEPRLRFAHDQILDDPKDGLMLFGPPEPLAGIEYGIIGTDEGIRQFADWSARLQREVAAEPGVTSSTLFPGFGAVFRSPWKAKARVTLTVSAGDLDRAVRITDPHQRVFDTVELFAKQIVRWVKEEDPKVALWFVVVPETVWKLCRPKSTISKSEGIAPEETFSHARAVEIATKAPDLFSERNAAAEKHLYENHFHNQLKAKLLGCEAVTQLVRQTTIAPHEFLNKKGKPKRKLQDAATVAWNLATGIYYKSGAKPWTLADIREGVCYIGLVFKTTNNPTDAKEACCGAQMFLHTGEGIVFKGAVGSWESDKRGNFHLPKDKATEIVQRCLDAYKLWHGKAPAELFIHARSGFNREEIDGFLEAAPPETKVTGIQIRKAKDLKLFRDGRRAVLRGLALRLDTRNAYLWSSGYVPKLKTYPGREVPSPLRVKVLFGDTPLDQVLADIMSLTKLNFNACIYSDGLPVTLRFANDVGEILTAIPDITSKPLPFRHYI
jgi:hypothetical protein